MFRHRYLNLLEFCVTGLGSLSRTASRTKVRWHSQIVTSDCTGKPDGLHSLGCTAEFLQCVDGSAYSLLCPAGLVFVEGVGACDAPSACSQKPKHATSGPVSYQATMASDKPESPGKLIASSHRCCSQLSSTP